MDSGEGGIPDPALSLPAALDGGDGGGAFTFTFRDDHGADTPALIYAAGAGTVLGNRTVLLPAGDATGVEVTPDTAWFQSGAATLTGLIAELSALKGGLGDTGILFDTGGGLAVNDGIGVKLQLTNTAFTIDQAWDVTGHDLEIDGAGALGASASLAVASLRRGGTATILGMMPLSEKVGLGAMDLLSGKKLQGAIMGGNRFPVDIPRLVDFYLRGLLDLDSIVAETIPLDRVNEGFDKMRKGDAARSVIVFDQ